MFTTITLRKFRQACPEEEARRGAKSAKKNHSIILRAWRALRPFDLTQDLLCGSHLPAAIQQATRI
jgi:hypothetical protein